MKNDKIEPDPAMKTGKMIIVTHKRLSGDKMDINRQNFTINKHSTTAEIENRS